MSSNRQQQSGGGVGSVPSTSSSSTGDSASVNGGNGVAGSTNGNNSGNVVPIRTTATAGEGLPVPALAVQSSRGGLASLSRPSPSSSGGSRKRSLYSAPLYNGLLNSYEDKSNDFVW